MKVPQLLTARAAASRTRTPWGVLRSLLEEAGYRVYRIAGRERVAEADLAALIEASRQRTPAESADRVGLAIELVVAEMGLARRTRRRRVVVTPGVCDARPEALGIHGGEVYGAV